MHGAGSDPDRSSGSVLKWVVPLLRCPGCRGPLVFASDTPEELDGILAHTSRECTESFPVIGEIPRLLRGPERGRLVSAHPEWFALNESRRALGREWMGVQGQADATVSAFDYEWGHFQTAGTPELASVFDEYFDLITPDLLSPDRTVLDAGCGAGRWALEVARRGPRVVAVDLGTSVETARRNTAHTGRVACVQADLLHLPLSTESVDWSYSLGVLHHVSDPTIALSQIVATVRDAGPVLLYVYYALDQRSAAYRMLFLVVDALRRATSTLPRPVAFAFAAGVAVMVYWPLARLARLAEAIGGAVVADQLPLAYYRRRSLRLMLNDSLDRFGTRVEMRFSQRDLVALFDRSGVPNVLISPTPPFWHAVGRRTG